MQRWLRVLPLASPLPKEREERDPKLQNRLSLIKLLISLRLKNYLLNSNIKRSLVQFKHFKDSHMLS